MAINIKELFNADADNIKVDKINYNFDQLLANGGGPAGIKGDQGVTGNTGTKGQKGEIGNKGDEGSKGEQGTSADLWDRDDLTSGSNDFTVLRPYNLEGGGASDFRTRVIIGQDTSIAIDTTPTAPTSLLNLVLPPVSNNDVSSQLSFINDETGDPREFKMATDYEVGTGSTFTFSAASPVSGEETNLTISMPNNILLNAKAIELSAANDIDIENTSIGNITIGNLSGETYDVRLFSDNIIRLETNEIELEASDIRANAGNIDITAASGTIDLSSDTTTLTAVVKNLLTSAENELLASGENRIVSSASGSANILNTTSTGGVNILQNSGVDKFLTSTQKNTSTQNVFFSVPNANHDGTSGGGTTGADHGDGIEFKEGDPGVSFVNGDTAYAAPNYNSSTDERTLSDYFEAKNINLWSGTAGHIRLLDTTALNAKEWYSGANWDSSISNTLNLGVTTGQTPITYNNWGNFNYTKIGNIIHGNGYVRVSGSGDGSQAAAAWLNADDENRMALIIELDNNNSFPYVNNSGSPCIVDVSIGGHSGDADGYNIINGQGDTAGQWQNPKSGLNSSNVALSGFRDIIRFKGIIPSGRNEIAIVYDSMNPGFESTGGLQNDIFTLGFAPAWVGGGYPVTFNFSFTMQTDWDSYNRIVLDTGAPGGGGGPVDDDDSGSGSESSSSGTEIEMFDDSPNVNAQEQPMTTWSTDPFAGNGGTFTQTFYSNMEHSTGGITFSNLPSWVSSASLSSGGSFPSSFPNLSGSTVYMWTLSVTLLGNASSNTRFASMDIVSDDPSTWSLPSGVSTWNISQQGL